MNSYLSVDSNSWDIVKISDVLFFQEGPGVRKWQFTDQGVKLLNVGNINNGQLNLSTTKLYLSEEEANGKYAHFLVDDGDLLIACSGIVLENFHNKIAFAESQHLPLCLNTSTMRFKALDENQIDLSFFKYYLQTNHFNRQLRRLITGSAQLNFGPSHVKKIELFLPPIKEQEKIVKILDAADRLRQKDKQLIEHYIALNQSLFLDMFGDPVTNPKKFKTFLLNDLMTKIGSGATPKGGKGAYIDKGISLVRSLNVHDNDFKYKDLAHINLDQAKLLSNVCLEENDVLLNITGASVCRVCLMPADILPARVNQHVSILRCDPDKINSVFLMNLLITKQYKRKLLWLAGAGGATREALTKAQIQALEVYLPSIDEQNSFAKESKNIESQKQKAKQSLAKSEELFNCLLQRAFKGELTGEKAA